jgi:hypothetical protein
MPDSPKVMTQTERDILVLQVGVECEAANTPLKIYCFEALRKKEAGWRTILEDAKVHERLQCQKKSRFLGHDHIGNRNRDLSACSAVSHRFP